jgi:hypothetical protein
MISFPGTSCLVLTSDNFISIFSFHFGTHVLPGVPIIKLYRYADYHARDTNSRSLSKQYGVLMVALSGRPLLIP